MVNRNASDQGRRRLPPNVNWSCACDRQGAIVSVRGSSISVASRRWSSGDACCRFHQVGAGPALPSRAPRQMTLGACCVSPVKCVGCVGVAGQARVAVLTFQPRLWRGDVDRRGLPGSSKRALAPLVNEWPVVVAPLGRLPRAIHHFCHTGGQPPEPPIREGFAPSRSSWPLRVWQDRLSWRWQALLIACGGVQHRALLFRGRSTGARGAEQGATSRGPGLLAENHVHRFGSRGDHGLESGRGRRDRVHS